MLALITETLDLLVTDQQITFMIIRLIGQKLIWSYQHTKGAIHCCQFSFFHSYQMILNPG